MQIRARPGREMTANGGLDVRGRYKAYGQDLTITRGQLVWNNNIVSDPRVNIRAQRRIADITAGIDVSGRAQSPRAQVWSDPVMSQSEALSYLVLGRKLATASSDENQQVAFCRRRTIGWRWSDCLSTAPNSVWMMQVSANPALWVALSWGSENISP